MSFEIQNPNLCVKCAENPPSILYTIRKNRTDFSPVSILTIFLGSLVIESQKVTLQVPMCNACRGRLRRRKWYRPLIILVGMLIIILGLWFIALPPGSLSMIPFLNSIAYQIRIPTEALASLATLILGMIVIFIGAQVGRERLVSTDGSTFRFYNPVFQQAFAEANPDLVR